MAKLGIFEPMKNEFPNISPRTYEDCLTMRHAGKRELEHHDALV